MSRFSFFSPDGLRWVFDDIFLKSRGVDYICRVSGTTSHPNIVGGFFFLGILSSYTLFLESSRGKKIVLGGIFLQIIALFLTFSRSAMIAVALGTLLWFYLIPSRHIAASQSMRFVWLNNALSMRKSLVPLLSVILLSIATCLTLFYTPLTHRGGVVNYNHNVQVSDDERLTYQEIAAQMIEKNPFLGVGFNHFQIQLAKSAPKELAAGLFSRVHNIYLLIGAEQGLLGLAAFLLFLFSVIRRAIKAPFNSYHASLLAAFLGFLFVGCCDFYLLRTNFMMFLFFSIAGFLAAPSLLSKSA